MTTNSRKVTLQMMIENKIRELYLKFSSSNIVVDNTTGETLTERLATITTNLDSRPTKAEVQALISAELAKIVDASTTNISAQETEE